MPNKKVSSSNVEDIQKRKNVRVILGFDPGTQVTGWGVIEHSRRTSCLQFGTIRPKRGKPVEERIYQIHTEAKKLIEEYKPDIVAVEDPFVGKNVASAMILGQARGVLLLAAVQAGIEVASYPPRSIKSSIVGRGSASKEQVQFMVKQLLGIHKETIPLDASDALAVALCHVNRHKLQALRKK